MVSTWRGLLTLALCAALVGPTPAAHAQAAPAAPTEAEAHGDSGLADDLETRARVLFERGVALAAERRWTEADALFRQSRDLLPRASTLFNLALSSFHLGRFEACEQFVDDFLRAADAKLDAEDIRDALALRERSRSMMAELSLHVSPSGALIWIDDAERPGGELREVRLSPGAHTLRAEAGDHESLRLELELAPAERRTLHVSLSPNPSPPPLTTTVLPSATAALPSPAPPAAPADPSVKSDRRRWQRDWRLWLGVGALLVAAGVTTAVMTTREDDAPRYDAQIATLRWKP